jgi:uncharacterized protein YdcH (DUF465 family)
MNEVSDIRERLVAEDSNFRRLVNKHQEYEKRLEELRSSKFLTEEEKIEEVTIKKLKLSLKDQMEEIIRRSSD